MLNGILAFICSLISFLVVLVILGVITFVVLKLLEMSCNRWLKIYISSMYGDDCSEWKLNNIIEYEYVWMGRARM